MIKAADILAASILIVDDKEANIALLAQMLRRAGYVSIASTGHPREVCELHRKHRYDLILLDLQMPGMDGFQVMEDLKTIETDGYLPVLVITAQPDLKLRALKGGAKDFVSKPFELAEVLIRVYNLLEVRLLHLEARKYSKVLEQTVRELEAGRERIRRQSDEAKHLYDQIVAEQKVSERLLLNVLPQAIAERLKARPEVIAAGFAEVIADSFPEATILFAGLHDFSRLTERLAAPEVVKLLNEIYSGFDALVQKLGLEKIKIIGESYMVAAGVPVPRPDHAEAIAEAALGLQQEVVRHDAPGGETFSLRIGINTGPVVAGVIGKTRFSYDVWGETVNTAWHMETYGAPGHIQVNETTYARLRGEYLFEGRGEFYVKDKGELKTYFLKGRKPNRAAEPRRQGDPAFIPPAAEAVTRVEPQDLSRREGKGGRGSS